MHREGHIIDEIIDYGNMSKSFDTVLRGDKRKKSREGKVLMENREQVIKELAGLLKSGKYRIEDYRERDIVEAGKERRIQIIKMRDRIAVNAVMSVLDEHLRKRLIRTTSASIKGRGTVDLMKYIRDNIRKDPQRTQYAYKFDIEKYYNNVNQDDALDCWCTVVKDTIVLELLGGFIHLLPEGLSTGLRSSQGTGNLLLSIYLDHPLKDQSGVKYYYRYCDDGLVLAGSKEELWIIRDYIHELVETAGLRIKSSERIFPITEGIDFLGYVIYPDHVMMRKRNKQNSARHLHKVKSRKRHRELVNSLYSRAKHGDCNNMFHKLTGKEMRSFKDLNVSYQPEDGKKRFPGTVVSIRELVNLPIIVKDFETGIKTEQGEDRCIVAIEMNGEAKKFFTNSEEMKNILSQIKEMPDGFPFETTIRTETFGKGRTKYVFS